MKDSLKGFPDEPRGSAWPSSARAVRCPVKIIESFLEISDLQKVRQRARPAPTIANETRKRRSSTL